MLTKAGGEMSIEVGGEMSIATGGEHQMKRRRIRRRDIDDKV